MIKSALHSFFRLFVLAFVFVFTSPLKGFVQTVREPIIVSYVTANTKPLPDVALITHINYAFGLVNEAFNGVDVSNEARLKEVVKLKTKSPDLKILLSIGGWGAGRFSEMAADDSFRMSFAKDCKRIVDEFALDGIDIDWEYPSSAEAGISAGVDDVANFTLLMRDIRKEIGNAKLLTLATIADAKYVNFVDINPYIDFVNVMMYDVSKPPFHHSALRRSELSGRVTAEEAVEAHLKAGVPLNKLVLGVPFYGRGDKKQTSDYVLFRDIEKFSNFEERWDDVAKVPYLVDSKGELVLTFENVKSIGLKGEYIRKRGLLGGMYWEFFADNDKLELSKALYNGLYAK